MNKRILFTIIIFIVFGGINLSFAQTQDELGQQLFQIYQATNDKIDRLINFIAMIATVFGVIVAIVVTFFAIRQITVDKEISAYKEEIKRQKELIKRETTATKKDLASLRSWATEKKEEIQKALSKPISKKTKQELKRLEAEIDKLREEIAYKRGSISTLPESGIGISSLGSIRITGTAMKICNKCGMTYSALEDPTIATTYSQCPYCGHINF